jgi:hypothetical protein
MRARIGRLEPPSLFEDVSEPATDIFGAAVLRACPDLSQIIAVEIMSLMLHGAISCFEKNAIDAAHRPGNTRTPHLKKIRRLNRGNSGWQ